MDDYVSKPIEPEKLFQVIRRSLPAAVDGTPIVETAPPAPGPAALPLRNGSPVNLAQLQSMVGNDIGKTRKFLDLFIRSAEPALRALDAAIEARDATALRRQAHKVRGSSANVGAEPMAKLAAQLERLAPEDWAQAEDLRVRLWDTYTETCAFAQGI
jgi:HPt (histidine-containing phosphotransfer) domain-containing protein